MGHTTASQATMNGCPAGTPPWITTELIELTIRVWQPYYQLLLSPEDAVTILTGVGRLYEALARRTGP